MEHPKSTQTVSPTNEYDIIVVGGGEYPPTLPYLGPSADNDPPQEPGCALAARFSEEPSLEVLLVESGERCFLDSTPNIAGNRPSSSY